ncbi:nucleoside hydrolase [Stenotrophomonas sp.]|uniref:nucleoside hydrolase n=1 Tax=Stenotrophomonas sp. TaxID=69392 RepID=UPI0028AE3013|nr:nucleoside hydrolase [Stenotrophomonas sp.]
MRSLLLAALLCLPLGAAAAPPVPVILDTDMGNDVDDVLAMALLHALEQRGESRLLGVTLSKDHPRAAPFVDAINTFYGRPDIPLGVVRAGATPEEGKFLGLIDQRERYPHSLASGEDAADALDLLRRLLAAQPDQSVVLVQVGFFTNFARLLQTGPDRHSPLAGHELVRRKVKLLSVMAGAFQTIDNHDNHYLEYNIIKDIPAARLLATQWPTPIIWSGYEIGVAAPYPHASIEQDFNAYPHHLVKDSYYLYLPPPHDRPSWDLTSVLAAVHPERGYFALSPAGNVVVEADGFTRFRREKGGRDRFLILDPGEAPRVVEALRLLVSQPPTLNLPPIDRRRANLRRQQHMHPGPHA